VINMNERIDNIIQSRDWTFDAISNLRETIDSIYMELQGELSGSEKLDIVWDMDVEITGNFGEGFNDLVKIKLSAIIAERISILLKQAKVVFEKPDTKAQLPEVPKEKPKTKVSVNDTTANTRIGDVKVERI